MPKRYQLILHTVEAFQVVNDRSEIDRGAQWCGGIIATEIDPYSREEYFAINVPTLSSGVQRASDGDYIVRNPLYGGFEVVKKQKFESEYELID